MHFLAGMCDMRHEQSGDSALNDQLLAEPSQVLGPPEAPRIDRQIDIPLPAMAIGLALLGIVTAALLQLFDVARDTVSGSDRSLRIEVDYPSRIRSSGNSYIYIRLSNQTGKVLEDVSLSFDETYFSGLSQLDFLPPLSRPWVVEFPLLASGERRGVHVTLQANAFGSQPGSITLVAAGLAPQRVEFSTFVLP